MQPTLKATDSTPQMRAVRVTLRLIAGHPMTTAEIARLTGLTHSGAWRLMIALSVELPIAKIGKCWQWIREK